VTLLRVKGKINGIAVNAVNKDKQINKDMGNILYRADILQYIIFLKLFVEIGVE
jgi:hypothetical protein